MRLRQELVARVDADAVVEPAGERGLQVDAEAVLAVARLAVRNELVAGRRATPADTPPSRIQFGETLPSKSWRS